MKSITFYDNIILLESSGAKLVGDFEIFHESDDSDNKDEGKNEAVFSSLTDVIKFFNNDKAAVTEINNRLEKNSKTLAKGGIKDTLILLITKLGLNIGKVWQSVNKAISYIWEKIKNLPGINSVSSWISNMLNKVGITSLGSFKIFGSTLKVSDALRFITVTFVLIGSLGFITKKIKQLVQNHSESLSVDINTTPLILTEADSTSETFMKKGTSALAKLVNFAKNIGSAAEKAIVGILGTMVAAGILLLIALSSRKLVMNAIEYSVNNKGKELNGIDKAKYVGAAFVEQMAKIATFGGLGMDIYVDDTRYKADYGSKRFTPLKNN